MSKIETDAELTQKVHELIDYINNVFTTPGSELFTETGKAAFVAKVWSLGTEIAVSKPCQSAKIVQATQKVLKKHSKVFEMLAHSEKNPYNDLE